jgi:hypothetical protein
MHTIVNGNQSESLLAVEGSEKKTNSTKQDGKYVATIFPECPGQAKAAQTKSGRRRFPQVKEQKHRA